MGHREEITEVARCLVIREGKKEKETKFARGGKGERDVSALILIPLLNVENYLSCAC